MASKRKAEGIALLSLYNDEDMDDVDDEEEEENEEGKMEVDRQEAPTVTSNQQEQSTENKRKSPSPAVYPTNEEERLHLADSKGEGGALGIVDYAHDEMAISPEPEEGEIVGPDQAQDVAVAGNIGSQDRTSATASVLVSEKSVTPEQSSLHEFGPKFEGEPQSNNSEVLKEAVALKSPEVNGVAKSDTIDQEDDHLADFLPPPPTTKCSEDLQNKFNKYLSLKNAGRSFNDELRNSKGYRNPDFLLRAVKYQEIDQIGSCFRKEIFDPHGYDMSDYYDALASELKREFERREQEKKKSQKVDFVHGGIQSAPMQPVVKAAQNVTGQKGMGASTGSAGVPLHSSSSVDSSKLDTRQNKKSKWDKVDGDKRNTIPTGAKDAMVAASSHAAALLSAANAGAGYSAFVQQKRKEAEEKKLAEKRSDK
eukprot:TRINITY_DN748_c0_g1_i1.p1 TRINITY_DN748_c0_g1~~TRINITY_DN748_c0_g1_i1.p1  ORF type:complete len:424 (+),score=134.28 TRINITY_DN748_c0_g1_i1:305-1576(+)